MKKYFLSLIYIINSKNPVHSTVVKRDHAKSDFASASNILMDKNLNFRNNFLGSFCEIDGESLKTG